MFILFFFFLNISYFKWSVFVLYALSKMVCYEPTQA